MSEVLQIANRIDELFELFNEGEELDQEEINEIITYLSFDNLKKRTLETIKYLILSSLEKMIISVANRVSYKDVQEKEDLIQQGSLAVLEHIKDYNIDSNTKFSSYIYFWIFHYMTRYKDKYLRAAFSVPLNAQKKAEFLETNHSLNVEDIEISTTSSIEKELMVEDSLQKIFEKREYDPLQINAIKAKYGITPFDKEYTYEEIAKIVFADQIGAHQVKKEINSILNKLKRENRNL